MKTSLMGILLLAGFVCHAGADPRPNIIFMLADDMGYGDLSVQGSRDIATPQLDRLAADGVRLQHFYVNSPICSSSRTAFLTGQYPQRWRITSYLSYRKENAARGMADYLRLASPSFVRDLQVQGYATGHFGKWHLGGQRDIGEAPLITEYGFDQSLTQFEGLGDRMLPVFSRPMRPRWGNENRHPLGVEQARLGRGKTEFVPRAEMTGRWVEAAEKFITEAKAAGKPFYVNLWPDDPHTPVEPSPAARGDGSRATYYRGVVEELDRDLGRLIDFVRNDPELRDNTIIIFASDNGPEANYGSTAGLRGEKTNIYEGGNRVPFIFWAPSLMTAEAVGKVNTSTVVMAMDLAPSLLALTGVAAATGQSFDGSDLSSVMLGQSEAPRESPVFWSRPPDHPGKDGANPDVAVRLGPWKLLLQDDDLPAELYNLERDPGEQHNVASAHPDVVQSLSAEISAWRKSTGI